MRRQRLNQMNYDLCLLAGWDGRRGRRRESGRGRNINNWWHLANDISFIKYIKHIADRPNKFLSRVLFLFVCWAIAPLDSAASRRDLRLLARYLTLARFYSLIQFRNMSKVLVLRLCWFEFGRDSFADAADMDAARGTRIHGRSSAHQLNAAHNLWEERRNGCEMAMFKSNYNSVTFE